MKRACAAVFAVTIVAGLAGAAGKTDTVLLGSADFKPSSERPIGWRGDWTGRFPGANPPTNWDVRGKHIWRSLRCSAKKPVSDSEGVEIPDGIVKEWLVLGPLPADPVNIDVEYVAGEASLRPDEGVSIGDLTWKIVRNDLGVDFAKVLEATSNQVAYAHVWLYSKDGGPAVSWFRHVHFMQVLVNGKKVYTNGQDVRSLNGGWPRRASYELAKGWNSVLFKVTRGDEKDWGFRARVWPGPAYQEEETNIAWTTPIPWWSTSGPIVVGDKVFATAEQSNLLCLDKKNGRIRWIQTITFLDTLTPEEKKANPDWTAKGDPLLAGLKQANAAVVEAINSRSPGLGERLRQKETVEKQIDGLAKQIGGKKYAILRQDGGYSCSTPLSDGTNVYAWFYNGTAACLNMDGDLKWAQHLQIRGSWEHGFGGTPVLADGRFVVLLHKDFTAFDAGSGKVLWKQTLQQVPYAAFGSLVPARAGADLAIISSSGNVVRGSDGRQLFTFTGKFAGECPTPVVDAGVWYHYDRAGAFAIKLPAQLSDGAQGTLAKFLDIGKEYMVASPLYYDGLLYCLDMKGQLRVLDMAQGKMVYEQKLPLSTAGWPCPLPSSPTLAGKYIYIMDSRGGTLVMEPGRTYRQIALNKIECLDIPGGDGEGGQKAITDGNPWFDGTHIYVRGVDRLICIGTERTGE